MILPTFKYHPDPLATGSVEKSCTTCACCGKARGFIYTGPVYADEEYDQCICPWCIADGSAHEKMEASFTDDAGIVGGGGVYGMRFQGKLSKKWRTEHLDSLAGNKSNGGRIVVMQLSSLGVLGKRSYTHWARKQ